MGILSSISPSLLETRKTWVSTGREGLSREKRSTQLAVLGPTPGRRLKYSSASVIVMDLREPRVIRPSCFSICWSTCLILVALIWLNPPHLMAWAMPCAGVEATASQLSKLALRQAKARPELESDVFWDNMVSISTSAGSLLGCRWQGPYSCSRSLITWLMSTGSKIPRCRPPGKPLQCLQQS
jgi:hypothetical protein